MSEAKKIKINLTSEQIELIKSTTYGSRKLAKILGLTKGITERLIREYRNI